MAGRSAPVPLCALLLRVWPLSSPSSPQRVKAGWWPSWLPLGLACLCGNTLTDAIAPGDAAGARPQRASWPAGVVSISVQVGTMAS